MPAARGRGFCVCRGRSPLTLHASVLADTAGSRVSELGLKKIQVSCRGGRSRGPLTARLLFRGGEFSPALPMLEPLLGLQSTPACVLCPWVSLAPVGQEMTAPVGFFWWPKDSIRGKSQRIVPAGRKDLTSTAFPCPGSSVLVKNIRPHLC